MLDNCIFKRIKQAVNAAIGSDRQLRTVALYSPIIIPWPWNTWWGPKLHPLQAALAMEFTLIEMKRQGGK